MFSSSVGVLWCSCCDGINVVVVVGLEITFWMVMVDDGSGRWRWAMVVDGGGGGRWTGLYIFIYCTTHLLHIT